MFIPQILKEDPRTSIPLRVMASSAMELQLGVLEFLLTRYSETSSNNLKQNASTIFVRRAAFHACLPSRSARSIYARD